MKPENVTKFIGELSASYPGTSRAQDGSKLLLRLHSVSYPQGCSPGESEAIVVLEQSQPAPQLLLKEIPTLPNGKTPRSCSPVPMGGETWHTFSFNQPWHEDTHTALQFVEGRLRRFAQDE